MFKTVNGLVGRTYFVAIIGFSYSAVALAQPIPQSDQIWSASVISRDGQPVVPVFDGWFSNEDGTRTLCFSPFSLNSEEYLYIPMGSSNFLEGAVEEVQLPTHFVPVPPEYRHKFCVFTVDVPPDFSEEDRVRWTLSSAGETLSVPGHVLPYYELDEPSTPGRGDVAPKVRVSSDGEWVQGRRGLWYEAENYAKVGEPYSIEFWVNHPDDKVWVGFMQYSGPGDIIFEQTELEVRSDTADPFVETMLFSDPGEYVVLLQSINNVAAFEFYCCHTNIWYSVTVVE
jgi:hypothetical protein